VADTELAWAGALLSASLRLAPVFAFAPPFTLLRVPGRVRVVLVLVLAACAASTNGPVDPTAPGFVARAAADAMAGLGAALALQLAFAALAFVGRLVDIQAGHGLAMLIDPSTRTQSPLVGSLFALVAGIAFFEINGHHVLIRLLAAPAAESPALAMLLAGDLQPLLAYLALVFSVAFGIGAAALAALFAVDLAIAFVSRSLPQMNVLMLGLQVKALALLVVLALSTVFVAPVLLRLLRAALAFAVG
jgi:flagellar biosynthesis protein FliR